MVRPMLRSGTLTLLTGLLLLAAGCTATDSQDGAAEAADGPLADRIEAVADEVESYVDEAYESWRIPALAVGIIGPQGLEFTAFRGQRHDGQAVDENTLFEIGSATKAMLGATLAIMVDRGKLAWEDPVAKYLPDFRLHDPWVGDQFEIVDLLAQRSGMPGFASTMMLQLGYSPAEVVASLRHVAPETSFRSTYAYQNAPHLAANEIVARLAGVENWDLAVEKLLLGPLGMDRSAVGNEVLTGDRNSTRGVQVVGDERRELVPGEFPGNAGGAGGLNSTLRDMAQWVRLHLGEGEVDGRRVIAADEIRKLYRPLVTVGEDEAPSLRKGAGADYPVGYATGWYVHGTAAGRVIEHGGLTNGFASAVGFDPDRGFGVVVLTNLRYGEGAANAIANRIYDLIQGRPTRDYLAEERQVAEQAAAAELAPDPPFGLDPDELVGVYENPVYGRVRIARQADDGLRFTFLRTGLHGELLAVDRDRIQVRALAYPQREDQALLVMPFGLDRDRTGRVRELRMEIDPGAPPFKRIGASAPGASPR